MTVIDASQSKKEHIVTKATPEDAPAVKSLIDAAFRKYIVRMNKVPAPMMANHEDKIKTQDVLVTRNSAGDIVGIITMDQNSNSNSIQIEILAIHPSAQGQGYGGALMDSAEAMVRARGITDLTVYTNVKMYESIDFYRIKGFLEIDRREEEGFERVYFQKTLS